MEKNEYKMKAIIRTFLSAVFKFRISLSHNPQATAYRTVMVHFGATTCLLSIRPLLSPMRSLSYDIQQNILSLLDQGLSIR